MMTRSPESHKGENGRVAVIGGSAKFHGAPIMAALGAEHAGADLIFPIVPKCHLEVTKAASLNFICHSFKGDILTPDDVPEILKVLENCDTVVIGPGLGNDLLTLQALDQLIPQMNLKTVVDASALEVIPRLIEQNAKLPEELVLTPHRGEFESFEALPEWDYDQNLIILMQWAKKIKATICLKGMKDIIASHDDRHTLNSNGNAGLTVGGTGDVLSGVIGGLMAQGMEAFEAASVGAEVVGTAGDELYGEKGYAYRAVDVAERVPYVLKKKM